MEGLLFVVWMVHCDAFLTLSFAFDIFLMGRFVQKVRFLPVSLRCGCILLTCIIDSLVTWLLAPLAFYLGLFRKSRQGEDERGEQGRRYLLC